MFGFDKFRGEKTPSKPEVPPLIGVRGEVYTPTGPGIYVNLNYVPYRGLLSVIYGDGFGRHVDSELGELDEIAKYYDDTESVDTID